MGGSDATTGTKQVRKQPPANRAAQHNTTNHTANQRTFWRQQQCAAAWCAGPVCHQSPGGTSRGAGQGEGTNSVTDGEWGCVVCYLVDTQAREVEDRWASVSTGQVLLARQTHRPQEERETQCLMFSTHRQREGARDTCQACQLNARLEISHSSTTLSHFLSLSLSHSLTHTPVQMLW